MRRTPRPQPKRAQFLTPVTVDCPECHRRLHADYNNFRTVTTLDGVTRLTLTIRRCPNPDCIRFLRPFRPEAEPHFALPIMSSASTSSPWSDGSATPSTGASPKSTTP